MTAAPTRPVSLLIAALGGEGGGVLTRWIVNSARADGLPVQATSIPGVAQRTGSTTYYIEIWPEAIDPKDGRRPVFSLAPAAGEVDIVAATELAEAARMIEAGYVTPDRTTLVASRHRVATTHEKLAMGDGRADSGQLAEAAAQRSADLIMFDMKAAATEEGAIVNSVMLGAISASGVLPVSPERFVAAIRDEGKAVESNLAGYQAGVAFAEGKDPASLATDAAAKADLQTALETRIGESFPADAHDLIRTGAERLIDYQDEDYARLYLDRLEGLGVPGPQTLDSVARHLAVRMSFEDVYRVAQAKTRAGRLTDIRKTSGAAADEPVVVSDFFKPRFEELCDALPAGLAKRLLRFAERRPALAAKSWPMEIRSTTVWGFLRLRLLAGLKGLRRSSLRYAREQAEIETWLGYIRDAAAVSDRLALEISECAGLIKGYGETHRRGTANFTAICDDLVRSAAGGTTPPEDAADAIATARAAALADPDGQALGQALAQRPPSPVTKEDAA